MQKAVWRLASVSLLLVSLAVACSGAGYLGLIGEAASRIELGDYDAAASAVEKAFAFDDHDPLGRMAMAVVYMHTGRLGDAERELRRILDVRPDDWRALYALGLIVMQQGKTADARKHFDAAAKSPGAQPELAALGRYINFLDSRWSIDVPQEDTSLPLAREVDGIRAFNAGRKDEAIGLLREVLRTPAPLGFEENRSPLPTFDPSRPVQLPKSKLSWKPAEHKGAPVVSGTVTLKADASRADGVYFVTFYIDDLFAAATNSEPYRFDWATTETPNGFHKVRIDGKDEWGNTVSSKSVWVKVQNANPSKHTPRSGDKVSELEKRLWSCIRVGESRKIAHYYLARIYLESGDKERAAEELEYVVAYQADFRDARKLLTQLRGRGAGYREISKGRSGSKRVALTFDDGPNERTAELLEMLKRLGVRATFFIVGSRAEARPELVRAIQAAGHQIENHTYTHPNLSALTADQAEAELSKTAAVIRAITGKPSFYFRPPGGHISEATRKAAGGQGLTGVFWTVNCSPFEGARYAELASHVIGNIADGGIILMHNGEPGTTSALPRIVEDLHSKGYRFVTVSELVENTSQN